MTIPIREQREAVEFAEKLCDDECRGYPGALAAAALTLAKVERGELVELTLAESIARKMRDKFGVGP